MDPILGREQTGTNPTRVPGDLGKGYECMGLQGSCLRTNQTGPDWFEKCLGFFDVLLDSDGGVRSKLILSVLDLTGWSWYLGYGYLSH